MQQPDPQLEQLETSVQEMQWGDVSLEPANTDQELDQELPAEWGTYLDERLAYEAEFDAEVLDPLYEMSEQELDNTLDIPEGNIDINAQGALNELETEIDLDAIALERDTELDLDQQQDLDLDFDR